MDKATELMFDIMHNEHLLLYKALGVKMSTIDEIDETYFRCKEKVIKEEENAN